MHFRLVSSNQRNFRLLEKKEIIQIIYFFAGKKSLGFLSQNRLGRITINRQIVQDKMCQDWISEHYWKQSDDHAISGDFQVGTLHSHYSDVIMRAIASQITGVLTACSTGCSGADQRKLQRSASPVTGRFHSWSASNGENVFIWWCHHDTPHLALFPTVTSSWQHESRLIQKHQGAVSIRKTVLPGMAIPMLKIRRPNGRLIFNMEITTRR